MFQYSESKLHTQIHHPVTEFVQFSPLQGHRPDPQDDSLQVPLLNEKECTGSKAPMVVLGEKKAPCCICSFRGTEYL